MHRSNRCRALPLIAIVACLTTLLIGCGNDLDVPASNLESREEIAWEPFTEESRSKNLESGKDVFVFVCPLMHEAHQFALEAVKRSQLARIGGRQMFATLVLKYDDWNDPRIRSVWKDVGHTKNPIVVLYTPGNPPLVFDAFSLKPFKFRFNKAATSKAG